MLRVFCCEIYQLYACKETARRFVLMKFGLSNNSIEAEECIVAENMLNHVYVVPQSTASRLTHVITINKHITTYNYNVG